MLHAMSVYADVYRYRELFGSLFRRDLRAKYKGSVLGLAWTLAHPLVLMVVYLLVFSVLWKATATDFDHYWLFLLAGLPAWVFFATSLQAASRSLLENANLIRKVRFPRQLVPLSVVATQVVAFATMLAIVIALSFVVLPEARDTLLLALPVGAAFVVFVSGLALAVASANAVFRDVEHLVSALLLPLFFLTPILYRLEDLPGAESHPWLVDLIHWGNPLTPPIEVLRSQLFFGTAPALGDVVYVVVETLVALVVGAVVFSRVDDRIAAEA
jgi:ABC-type polysaccharide/polyol phosphate export permease